MISEFFARLKGQTPSTPLPPLDAKLAIGALLVRLAKADSHYAFEEIVKIDALIGDSEGVNAIEAAKLRAICEKLEAQAPETETFTALVQASVPYENRIEVFEALWDVSLADGVLKPEEETFLAGVALALAINADDSAASAARHGHGG